VYKTLRDDLNQFKPDDQKLLEIAHRVYSSDYVHKGANREGEEYENWVYENLKEWAINNPMVQGFLLKKVGKKTGVNNGLGFDQNSQIIFYENGRKAAEYDGMFIYNNKLVIVESSISELRKYYRDLESRLEIKRELLVDFFCNTEIYSLLVTRPRKKTLPYRVLDYLVNYKLKNPEISIENPGVYMELDNPKLMGLEDFISRFSSLSSSSF
jgi:hypothetical protein